MRSAALLPTPGDPYVFAYWARNYAKVWRGEVDELHVLVNGVADCARPAVERTLRYVGVQATVVRARIGHGEAIGQLLAGCDADMVVLVEDDGYVREPGAIADRIGRVWHEGGVIGSPRGGMSPDLEQAALARWGPVVGPDTSSGHGLWPCFLFARRDDLLATDRRFDARSWRRRAVVPGLEHTVAGESATTDTFTSAAFQLRAKLPITLEVQHKELWQKQLPPGGAPWFHAGGLSNGDFLADRWDGGGARAGIGGSMEGLDWAHRAWWWTRCLDTAGDLLLDNQPVYRARLERLVEFTGVRAQLEEWTETLLPWITWDDGA